MAFGEGSESRDPLACRTGAEKFLDVECLFFLSSSKNESHRDEKWQSNPTRRQSLTNPRGSEGPLKPLSPRSPTQVSLAAFAFFTVPDNLTDSQAESTPMSPSPTKKCASCNTLATDPEKALKPCAKCQSVHYCSRDCQKKDWKLHKKMCATAAQIYAQNANLKPASAPRVPKKKGHRGGLQKWQFDT